MAIEALAGVPSPEAGEGRVGATAAQLDALFAGENNPHPNPPPAWGRGKSIMLVQMRYGRVGEEDFDAPLHMR
jgi:hypothetical protein